MNRRDAITTLVAGLFAIGCRTKPKPTVCSQTVRSFTPRSGQRLQIVVDNSQPFSTEAGWLAEQLRSSLIQQSQLHLNPVVYLPEAGCPIVDAPVHSQPAVDFIPVESHEDIAVPSGPFPILPMAGANFEVTDNQNAGPLRLLVSVDSLQPYRPMSCTTTFRFEDGSLREPVIVQETWHGSIDGKPVADRSSDLQKALGHPATQSHSNFQSAGNHSPREFLRSIACQIAWTVSEIASTP